MNSEWVNVALVHTGGTLYAYKNGELVGQTASGPSGGMNGYQRIGGGTDNGKYFSGNIDKITIWNRI